MRWKRPPAGPYRHELVQRNWFDPFAATALDTWHEAAGAGISRRLRCFTAADRRLLLEPTGPEPEAVLAGGDRVDLAADRFGHADMLRKHHE